MMWLKSGDWKCGFLYRNDEFIYIIKKGEIENVIYEIFCVSVCEVLYEVVQACSVAEPKKFV